MTSLFAGLAATLLLWGAAIAIDLRAARCPLAMYIRDARHLSVPLNAALYLCTPKAERAAILPIDSRLFPHLEAFRQNWKLLSEEAARVYAPEMAHSDRGFAFKDIGGAGWRQFFIRWHGTIDPAAVAFCPGTSQLVHAAPEIKIAFFSIVEPKAHIKPHIGPYRGVLRYQLGLRTPNDLRCYISVDGTRDTYYDGHDVIFDDTYIHEVANGCDQPRVILFLDIERPFPGRGARAFNRLALWVFSLFPGKANGPTALSPPATTRTSRAL